MPVRQKSKIELVKTTEVLRTGKRKIIHEVEEQSGDGDLSTLLDGVGTVHLEYGHNINRHAIEIKEIFCTNGITGIAINAEQLKESKLLEVLEFVAAKMGKPILDYNPKAIMKNFDTNAVLLRS